MSQLLPLGSITPAPEPAPPSYELALPHPITGKTRFLRLPCEAGWTYEVRAEHLRAEQHLLLRNQMWVRRGRAQFSAVHTSSARVQVTAKIRPWSPNARPLSARETPLSKPPDERTMTRPWMGILRQWLTNAPAKRLTIQCYHTERRIELRWKISGQSLPESDFNRLLTGLQCH